MFQLLFGSMFYSCHYVLPLPVIFPASFMPIPFILISQLLEILEGARGGRWGGEKRSSFSNQNLLKSNQQKLNLFNIIFFIRKDVTMSF